MLKIYKHANIVRPLIIFLFLIYPPVAFAQGGYLKFNDLFIDYSRVNGNSLQKQADDYFVKAFDAADEQEREKNYHLAMHKYFVLVKAYPYDSYAYVQIGRIHDENDRDRLAKKHFFHALNLDRTNPYTNYYFGQYYEKRQNYNKALKYYLSAYNNGYKDNYYANLKLACMYERLGDIKKAIDFYSNSYKINPNASDIYNKIQSLNSLNYEHSEYYHFIRE